MRRQYGLRISHEMERSQHHPITGTYWTTFCERFGAKLKSVNGENFDFAALLRWPDPPLRRQKAIVVRKLQIRVPRVRQFDVPSFGCADVIRRTAVPTVF